MIGIPVLLLAIFFAAFNGIATAAEDLAQGAVGRALNSLPEGLLLALCAWLLLRLMRGTNAGTRFLVWLTALAAVAGLPLVSGLAIGGHALGRALGVVPHPEVTVPASWAIASAAIWTIFALIALLRLAAGVMQVRTIRRTSAVADHATLDPLLREALVQPVKGRAVRLLVSDAARVPAAIGFWQPAIVLPAWCLRELSAEQLQPILLHEMAHLRRRDGWTNLFQKLVRAIFFFHPAVWWIDARLSLEREMACDDAVLAATGDARSYAGTLIGLLERGCARRGWTMAQAAVARAREASLRIARILSGNASSTTRVGRGVLGLAAALCVACCGVLAVVPQMVSFAPDAEPAHPALAANRIGTPIPSGVDLRGSLHSAAVVPALFHPAAQPAVRVAPRRLKHSEEFAEARRPNPHSPAEPVLAGAPAHAAAPQVVMARLDQTQAPSAPDHAPVPQPQAAPLSAQGVMLVETQYAQPGAASIQSSSGGDDLNQSSPGEKAAAQHAIPMQAVEVRTVQVVEQDETGVHVRTWRVVLLVPVLNGGPMQT